MLGRVMSLFALVLLGGISAGRRSHPPSLARSAHAPRSSPVLPRQSQPWPPAVLWLPAGLRYRDQAEQVSGGGGFHTAAHAQRGEDARHVRAGSFLRDEQPLRDLTVG